MDLLAPPHPGSPRPRSAPAQAQTGRSRPSGGKGCGPTPQGRCLSEAPGDARRAGECVEWTEVRLGQLRGCRAVCEHVAEAAVPPRGLKAGAGLPTCKPVLTDAAPWRARRGPASVQASNLAGVGMGL